MAILEIKDLTFTYPGAAAPALSHIDLSVEEGEFLVILGESGCGKSTLLRQLKREIAPHGERSGEILYRGTSLEELDARTSAGQIGFVMQNPDNQIVTDKVWHELAFALENLGFPTPVIRQRVAEMASFFGIQSWFKAATDELSGGQKQLVNLAGIMVLQPDILILDEPTSQLDPIAAAEFIQTLTKLNRELGLTILLVEHRLEEVFPVADRAVVMENGRIAIDAPPRKACELLRAEGGHPALYGLPAAVRIYHGLNAAGECPITVREGRTFLTQRYRAGEVQVAEDLKKSRDKAEPAAELKEIWFRYAKDLPDVLEGANLVVRQGEIFALLGGNGSGKTTTLNVMAGLSRPYRGTVKIFGKKLADYAGDSLYRGRLALLPQNPQSVFIRKTLRQDLADAAKAAGIAGDAADEAVLQAAAEMKLSALLDRHPYDLSGGEQQKAAITKVLILQPKLFLLDEPTKGIDARAKAELTELLKGLKEKGLTVVLVTHDVEFAAETADRCALFFGGGVVSEGTPGDFFSGNNFYTTAANRICRQRYPGAVTCGEVIQRCGKAGEIPV